MNNVAELPTAPTSSALQPEYRCDGFSDPVIAELCKKTRHKADLTQDEILLLALAAGQAALARYVEPGHRDAEDILNAILGVLDHDTVTQAVHDKSQQLLSRREALEGRPTPSLTDVLQALYESEINAKVSMSSFWDAGWQWKLQIGDEMNGFEAEETFMQSGLQTEAAAWLIGTAMRLYPQSTFAKTYRATPSLAPADEQDHGTAQSGAPLASN
jgi:hypothetical protein